VNDNKEKQSSRDYLWEQVLGRILRLDPSRDKLEIQRFPSGFLYNRDKME
jgi:hypothetical protein